MRGGTSKAVFLRESDLPVDEAERTRTILSIFGSPDRRQIDGLGGADPLTSKLAIIGPVRSAEPRAAGTHLTYTFGQVEIAHPDIDWLSLCGNISSAVGAFAIYEGYVKPIEPMTQVRVFNTNLSRVLTIEVPVQDGRPLEHGDYSVPGVPGTGAKILIDFPTRPAPPPARCFPPDGRSIVSMFPTSARLTCHLWISATRMCSCVPAIWACAAPKASRNLMPIMICARALSTSAVLQPSAWA
jgi:2-methylaconitate cis-trans-isomerase PrpF